MCAHCACKGASEVHKIAEHSRKRLGTRLGTRLIAGVCFLVACAALHGRHCGVCPAAHAMARAHASGLWAWRVLALAWQVPALAWQVPWQVLCSTRHGTRHWLVGMACAGACMACAGACMACAGACMACAGACMACASGWQVPWQVLRWRGASIARPQLAPEIESNAKNNILNVSVY